MSCLSQLVNTALALAICKHKSCRAIEHLLLQAGASQFLVRTQRVSARTPLRLPASVQRAVCTMMLQSTMVRQGVWAVSAVGSLPIQVMFRVCLGIRGFQGCVFFLPVLCMCCPVSLHSETSQSIKVSRHPKVVSTLEEWRHCWR